MNISILQNQNILSNSLLISLLGFFLIGFFLIFGFWSFGKYQAKKSLEKADNERRAGELEEAKKIQQSMLPKVYPEIKSFDVSAGLVTSTEIGGDYYDFFPQEDGSMYVVCGDATGHGLNAGMMVSITKAGLYGSDFATPATTTTRINKTIKAIDLGTTRMSLNLAKLNNVYFDFTSAGMPPAYLYKHDLGEVD